MSNELQDFIEIHSRPKTDDKVYILEFSVSNDCSVEHLSALENHLFYHLKEFTKKANNEANLNGNDLDIYRGDGTGTNTYLNKFATYGFLYGFIFMYGMLRFSKKVFSKNLLKKYIFFVLLLMMFSNEDVRNSFLFNMIFFYGMIGQLSELKLKNP